MRINGNYFERFLFSSFPFIIAGGFICYLFKIPDMVIAIISIIVMSVLLFIIDKLPLWKVNFSNFTIADNKLFIDGREIILSDISFIRSYKTSPPQSLLVFEFNLQDHSKLNFMDKPKTIFYKSKNELRSKSLDILFEAFPSLKSKLRN